MFWLQMTMNVLWGLITAGVLVWHGSAVTLLVLSAVNGSNVMARKCCWTVANVNSLNVRLVMKQASKANVLVSQFLIFNSFELISSWFCNAYVFTKMEPTNFISSIRSFLTYEYVLHSHVISVTVASTFDSAVVYLLEMSMNRYLH